VRERGDIKKSVKILMTFLNILQQRCRNEYVKSQNTLKHGDAADYRGASMRMTKQLCRKDNFFLNTL